MKNPFTDTGKVCVSIIFSLAFNPVLAYPIDAYDVTGIGRLYVAQEVQDDRHAGTKLPRGGLLTLPEVDLRLVDHKDMQLPSVDPGFTSEMVRLLGDAADRYSISVLDLSDLDHPRYAEHQGTETANPGSVGKILVVLSVFQLLADIYPNDLKARHRLLKETQITADEFVISDHHTVRLWDRANQQLNQRQLRPGDTGSLWEFLDWMMSASSNAAASMVIKQAMLLERFRSAYPVPQPQQDTFFSETKSVELGRILAESLHTPVSRNGLDLNILRQGSFFTHTGQKRVPGTTSYASTRELIRYLLKLEQGKLVDEDSSREIKRLLYSTERRIRYASSPALSEAAVYFKSGSLYQCQPEEGFVCKKYHGNVRNMMNSVAIIESPARDRKLFYFVALMSNVLRKNSAVDHQTLATQIHRTIENHYKVKAVKD